MYELVAHIGRQLPGHGWIRFANLGRHSARSFTNDLDELHERELQHPVAAQLLQRSIAKHRNGFCRVVAHVLDTNTGSCCVIEHHGIRYHIVAKVLAQAAESGQVNFTTDDS